MNRKGKNYKNLYYVYLHIDPRTSQEVYVGKGSGSRAWALSNRKKTHRDWIEELKDLEMLPIIKIAHVFDNERAALVKEVSVISFLIKSGRKLLNANKGGGGHPGGLSHPMSGKEKSLEVRTKISKSLKGRSRPDLSEVTRARMMGNTLRKGKKSSLNTREKISNSLTGNQRRSEKIICLNNGKIYGSIKEAWTELNLDERSVFRVLGGEYSHTKGYRFRYV
jgi:hypothetical protein